MGSKDHFVCNMRTMEHGRLTHVACRGDKLPLCKSEGRTAQGWVLHRAILYMNIRAMALPRTISHLIHRFTYDGFRKGQVNVKSNKMALPWAILPDNLDPAVLPWKIVHATLRTMAFPWATLYVD